MRDAQAEAKPDPLIGSTLLGRYRLLQVLGQGGMGRVYLAEQKMGTAVRKVAIKTLHSELSSDPQLVARFYRESETVIELSHPNTIQFYDFGELESGTLFIVMEFIEGESLAVVLQRGPLAVDRIDRIVIQICGSLNEAHSRGIVHRDLKPENVLLTTRGGHTDFVKVLDFGIAKRNEAEDEVQSRLTKQGMVLGTPPYMSPEQFSGQALDARSDVYSLGVMVYEMLTGSLPFQAKTPWEWASHHLTSQPIAFETFPNMSGVPATKKLAVMRALAKNREHRQSSALEFLTEFTGHHDAQAAWTMATTPGALLSPRVSSVPDTRPAEPGRAAAPSMAETAADRASGVRHAVSRDDLAAVPFDSEGSNEDDPNEVAAHPRGIGKAAAIVIVLLFVAGGLAAGGIYYWVQERAEEAALSRDLLNANRKARSRGTPSTAQVATPPETNGKPVPPAPEEGPSKGPRAAVSARSAERTKAHSSSPASREDPRREPDSAERGGRDDAKTLQAKSFVAAGSAALEGGNIDSAVAALSAAQKLVGRRDPVVDELQRQLTRKASNSVGILIQQGRCQEAQALYTRLRTAGAESASKVHFSDDWCKRP